MNKSGLRVVEIQTDRGTEFVNATMEQWANSMGIEMRQVMRLQLPTEWKAERCIRTIKDKARTMMVGVKGSPSLWSEAVAYATHVSNVSPVDGKGSDSTRSHVGCEARHFQPQGVGLARHTLGSQIGEGTP
jgi:2-oxoglutarate dehydrogenase complex dehydrogenase (E1) component-like enzyme